MFRWTLFLCAGLFLALQVGGEDRGQKRLGLIEGEQEALAAAQAEKAKEDAKEVTVAETPTAPAAPARPARTNRSADTVPVEVAFAVQDTPLIAPAEDSQVVPAAARAEGEALGTLKYVSGRSVNVRSGPSTRDPVVGKLVRGDAVLVVWAEDNGWARIRVEGDGVDGYMSLDFLTDDAP